jgi:tRNA threonylcarbamoyladenosine biosynthesis protein TsaE
VSRPPARSRVRAAGIAVAVGERILTLDALEQEAEHLWRALPPHSVVWLSGELGAGKTTFVQAVTRAAGAESARSPTYALVHEYASPTGTIAHVDCYRLRTPDEASDLDLDGLRRRARLVLIEWPERAGAYAPPPDAHLRFHHADRPDDRRVERVT